MADDLDQVQDDFRTAFAAATRAIEDAQAAFDRLCAHVGAPPSPVIDRPDLGLKGLIPSGEAAELARRAKSTMTNWCRANKIDGEKGFAQKIGSRWFVSKSRLLRHLASGSSD
jgi:hypothetical protein